MIQFQMEGGMCGVLSAKLFFPSISLWYFIFCTDIVAVAVTVDIDAVVHMPSTEALLHVKYTKH